MAALAGLLLLMALFWRKLSQSSRDATGFVGKIPEFLQGIGTGIQSVRAMEKRGLFLFHTLFIWACYFFMSYVLFKAIPSAVRGWGDRCVARHGRGRNWDGVPAPGGIGSYQYFVKLGFMAVGFEAVDGLAAANVVWLTQSVMLITMGALSYQMLYMYRMNRA